MYHYDIIVYYALSYFNDKIATLPCNFLPFCSITLFTLDTTALWILVMAHRLWHKRLSITCKAASDGMVLVFLTTNTAVRVFQERRICCSCWEPSQWGKGAYWRHCAHGWHIAAQDLSHRAHHQQGAASQSPESGFELLLEGVEGEGRLEEWAAPRWSLGHGRRKATPGHLECMGRWCLAHLRLACWKPSLDCSQFLHSVSCQSSLCPHGLVIQIPVLTDSL